MITAFKDKYIDLLKTYYYVGGMPAAVNAYAESGNLSNRLWTLGKFSYNV